MLAGPAPAVKLPRGIANLIRQRLAGWNDPSKLAPLYAANAVVLETEQVVGRRAASEVVGTRFARPYQLTPLAFAENGGGAQLAAMYTRGEGAERTNVGLALLTFEKERSGKWVIASESMKFPAPSGYAPIDSDKLVQLLDEADIQKSVVLSIAYAFESPFNEGLKNPADKLRAENDWTAAQVARHPDRLVGFCSVNPLTDTALPEIRRCKDKLHMTGLKLHLGNSRVDFKNSQHLALVRSAFETANRLRMPIVVHLWNGPDYGRQDAQNFYEQVLAAAPDVVVQIAHMAGGGPGWTDEALQVFVDGVRRHDPRARNLYFDVATVADLQKPDQLALLATRIRQIGPERVLYGSDSAFGGHNTPDQEWGTFRGMVPLTDAEFAVIRDNLAPYLR